ncbi:MAG: hypothetical protein JJD97_11155 [Gemmatimonadaceae bacterium]|nr:hypothetical protein [Gemmatimonadaceae bacterium]
MPYAPRTAGLALAAAFSLAIVACRGSDKAADGGKAAGTAQSASVPTVQYNKAPCDWISRAEVEKVIGEPLTGDPVRVRSAENPIPQADGDGCLYELKSPSELTKRTIAVGLVTDDAGEIQAGFSGVPDIQAVFKDKVSKGDSMVDGRWDYVSGVPGGLTMAREGRITAQIFAFGESEKGMAVASAIMDKVQDLPFANDPADLTAPTSDPDPCSLITRQEAEAVLGPLKMAPYRSRESTAIAHANGSSCSYFTGKHRALVVTPTYSGGAMQFKMMAGVGSMVSGVLGGAKAPDTIQGKWDQITTSATGTLVFLKGDQMVDLQFKSSSTDYNGAVKLARAAAVKL